MCDTLYGTGDAGGHWTSLYRAPLVGSVMSLTFVDPRTGLFVAYEHKDPQPYVQDDRWRPDLAGNCQPLGAPDVQQSDLGAPPTSASVPAQRLSPGGGSVYR